MDDTATTQKPTLKRIKGRAKVVFPADQYIGRDGFAHWPLRDGDNFWALPPISAPDDLLRMYGHKLAADFVEYVYAGEGTKRSGILEKVLNSMPTTKGPVEQGFMDQLQRLAFIGQYMPPTIIKSPGGAQ